MERKLPEKYLKGIRPITIEGVKGFVWDRTLLLEFLQDRECQYYAVLGGDVIRITDGVMSYTYDNWSVRVERSPTESFEGFVQRCKNVALKYINAYPEDKNIFFAPVITSEVTAGLVKS